MISNILKHTDVEYTTSIHNLKHLKGNARTTAFVDLPPSIGELSIAQIARITSPADGAEVYYNTWYIRISFL